MTERAASRGRHSDHPHPDPAAASGRPEADHDAGGRGGAGTEAAPRRDADQGARPRAPLAAEDRERAGEVDHRPCGAGGRHGRLRLPAPAAHLPGAGHRGGDPRRAAAEGAEAGRDAGERAAGVGGAAGELGFGSPNARHPSPAETPESSTVGRGRPGIWAEQECSVDPCACPAPPDCLAPVSERRSAPPANNDGRSAVGRPFAAIPHLFGSRARAPAATGPSAASRR